MAKYFKLEEMKCHDEAKTAYPIPMFLDRWEILSKALDVIREEVGEPVYITSGYRTVTYNAAIKGAKQSMHCEGVATDLKTSSMIKAKSPHYETMKLYDAIMRLIERKQIPDGGVGLYIKPKARFVHYDCRTYLNKPKARWREIV